MLITGGTTFAQVANTLFSPIITRLYSPEEYGILTVYTAILGLISIAGALKYEWSIPIADSDEKAANLIALCIIIISLFSIVIAILLIFWGNWFLNIFNGNTLSRFHYLITIGVFLTGVYNIFTQWAFRKKRFKDVSKTKINQSIMRNIIMVGFGIANAGPIGLLIGKIVGQSAGATTLLRGFLKEYKYLIKKINLRDIIWGIKRYKKFPLFTGPGQVLNTAGLKLPVFFISSIYGSAFIGFYGLANTVVSLPMNLIGRSVGDVFYSEAASIGRTDPERLKKLSDKLFKKLLLLGLIPLFILLFFGPILFKLVFGSNWIESGVYARIIAFLVYVRFIFTPISRVYNVFERQKEALGLDILRVILVVLVFGIAKKMEISSYWAIILYAIAMFFIYLITYLGGQHILNSAIKNIRE